MRLLSHRHTKFRSAQRPNRKKARFLGESERTYEHRNELGAGHRTVRIKHAVSRSVHDQLVRHPLDVTLRPMSLDILESSVGANRSVHTVIWAIKVAVSLQNGRDEAWLSCAIHPHDGGTIGSCRIINQECPLEVSVFPSILTSPLLYSSKLIGSASMSCPWRVNTSSSWRLAESAIFAITTVTVARFLRSLSTCSGTL